MQTVPQGRPVVASQIKKFRKRIYILYKVFKVHSVHADRPMVRTFDSTSPGIF